MNDDATYTMPAFIDSHLHMLALGKKNDEIDLSRIRSIAEAIQLGKTFEDRGVIICRDFDQNLFEEGRYPEKKDLNKISTDKPVMFRRVCRHMCVVNDVLLKRIASMDTSHFFHLIDTEKGQLFEDAVLLADKAFKRPDKETLKRYLETAGNQLERHGIVAVASDDFETFDIPYETVIQAYEEAYNEDRLRVKVIQQMRFSNLKSFHSFLADGHAHEQHGGLTLGPLKILADGSLGARTAALWDDYSDDSRNRGVMSIDDASLHQWIDLANTHDVNAHVHVIGDKAAHKVMHAIKKALDSYPRRHRHALIHAQITGEETLKDMQAYDVSAIVQPVFMDRDLGIVKKRLGNRWKQSYLFHRMFEKGIAVGFSSDAPIETTAPFRNIYHAMTRKSLIDPDLKALDNDWSFTMKESIRAYTKTNMDLLELTTSPGTIVLNKNPYGTDVNDLKNIRIKHTTFH